MKRTLITIFWIIIAVFSYKAVKRHCGPQTSIKEGSKSTEALFDTVTMDVSAYCPKSCCCGKYADGITASGKPAVGQFVAAPLAIPFGTFVAVPGYADGRPVPVWDRGSAIQGNKLDVFMENHQQALNWGRQNLKVRIYK